MDAASNSTEIQSPEASCLGIPHHVFVTTRPGQENAAALRRRPVFVPVTSHITGNEAVSEAEIDLVLHVLRDTIADIMRDDE